MPPFQGELKKRATYELSLEMEHTHGTTQYDTTYRWLEKQNIASKFQELIFWANPRVGILLREAKHPFQELIFWTKRARIVETDGKRMHAGG